MLIVADGADVREVESQTHGLVGLAWGRRADAAGGFKPLRVLSGSITLNEPGSMPGRTCSVMVAYRDTTGQVITEYVNPLGSWLQLAHKVTRFDGTSFTVPLGTFRVDSVVVDDLAGSVEVSGSDAGVLVREYGLTLNSGEILPAVLVATALSTLLDATVDGIPIWWSVATVDTSACPTIGNPTRLQYTGSRVEAIAALAGMAGVYMGMPLGNTFVFQARRVPRFVDPCVVTVRPGEVGNMVDHRVRTDRQGLANVALLSYTIAGTELNRRLQVEYSDSTSDIRAGGPFGRVTMDVQTGSATINSDNDAALLARGAIKGTLSNATDIEVRVSPIYGIEPGDRVNVENHDLTVLKGQVVGGSVGLTVDDEWSLRVRTFTAVPLSDTVVNVSVVPGGRAGATQSDSNPVGVIQRRDNCTWWDYPDVGVDTSGNSARGWAARAGSATVTDAGTNLRVVATGLGHIGLITAPSFVAESKRTRAMASVRAESLDLLVQIIILTSTGTMLRSSLLTVAANTTALLSVETGLAAGTLFQVLVDANVPDRSAPAAGTALRVSNVVVQYTSEVPL